MPPWHALPLPWNLHHPCCASHAPCCIWHATPNAARSSGTLSFDEFVAMLCQPPWHGLLPVAMREELPNLLAQAEAEQAARTPILTLTRGKKLTIS